jgi:hypothetical protein
MAARSTDTALDAALARRVEAQARIAESLVELDGHAGHRLLATATLTGESAQRWQRVCELLPRLWADLATHRRVVAAACAVRTRKTRPGEREWTELQRLLVDGAVEVQRTPVALHERGIAEPAEQVSTLTLDELATRMDGWFREVVDVVEAAEVAHLAALDALGPLAERLRAARTRADLLLDPTDPDVATLEDLAAAVDARLAECTHDPLPHAGRGPRDLAGDLDDALAVVEARLATLSAVCAGWAQQRGEVADAVAALDALWAREDRARREACDLVAHTGLSAPADPRPALRRRLAALPGPGARPGPRALAALPALAADTADAAAALQAAISRAVGLTDRCGELRGRFAAYRAKAARLGVAEEPEVRALAERVRALLDDGPVDLRALTPALVAYRTWVSGTAGGGR